MNDIYSAALCCLHVNDAHLSWRARSEMPFYFSFSSHLCLCAGFAVATDAGDCISSHNGSVLNQRKRKRNIAASRTSGK